MSDRAALLIEHLADGPQTTDDLVEATGLERSAVSQELAGLKHAGTVHSGRGVWHLADRPPAKVKRHEAAESTAVEDKLAKDRKRKAAKKAAKAAPQDAPTPNPTWMPPPVFGWVCPRCGRGNAPMTETCPCGPAIAVTCGSATA